MFDMNSGTIELWLKSDHAGRELTDHHYLNFSSATGRPASKSNSTRLRCRSR